MEHNELFDVTIIGGGPAGLFSAFYSGLRDLKTKIIEFQSVLGGKVNVYPEKMIWDVGGMPPLLGEQLIKQMTQQGLTFAPEVVLNQKVTTINQQEDKLFEITTESGQVHYSRTIILAIGGGILKPQRIEIEGAEKFESTNLSYKAKSLKAYKGKKVLISGGKHTAVDWANALVPIAEEVHVIYRNDAFSGHEAPIRQLLESSANCYFHTTISKLIADNDGNTIKEVELFNSQANEVQMLEVDEVLINHGYDREAELLNHSEIKIDRIEDFYVSGTAHGQSSLDGVYAAGDILKFDGKLHLIAGAFQDAANAVNQAKQYITPEADEYAMVSSHNDHFKKRNKKLIEQMMQ
ncbi:thioredoxin reductase (NADPH) [Amphibacillus marinus]|uniref:Ferredoxin--NADP reductase n=1 Tax=Amphibacillus marinus TaxID=872970 RepID=A0A1H8KBB1_9BACI|nr:NAD(P)/FAD-dependent oxidoreductase [Amphibacillus marinus]SEN89961.1 thioredoxin reductase (NADPH) [Amphibacillus marinus]